MGRPREHDASTRAALLGEAERLLASGGLGAVSIREVADAVGTSTRAVYSVFGGRPGLIAALYARGFEVLGQYIDELAATKDPGQDLVRIGVDGFRRFALAHPNLFRLTFERLDPDFQPGPDELAAAQRTLGKLRDCVRRCRDAGLLGTRRTAEVTWQLHAFVQGLASIELHGWVRPLEVAPEVFWREGLEAFVAGLAQPAPRRPKKRS